MIHITIIELTLQQSLLSELLSVHNTHICLYNTLNIDCIDVTVTIVYVENRRQQHSHVSTHRVTDRVTHRVTDMYRVTVAVALLVGTWKREIGDRK